jgi:3',5'-cyclic AMP phosphodiesterase CpdA
VTVRVLHFSDIHLQPSFRGVPLSEWLGKRLVGYGNLRLRRWKYFVDAADKVVALDRFRSEQDVDLVICSGDYTVLGTEGELRGARAAVDPLTRAPRGFVNVPGNHDIYTWDVVRDRRYYNHFGDTLETDLPEYLVRSGPWPVVRLVGGDVAVVAVNSARPNPPPWRSSGRIPRTQLEMLSRILADERVAGRFVFIVTHYAPRLRDGRHDRWNHGLVNADEFLDHCARVDRGAILCGHVHRRYCVRVEGIRPPIVCAGSTTQMGGEGLWLFEVDGERARAIPGTWRDGGYVLEPDKTEELG